MCNTVKQAQQISPCAPLQGAATGEFNGTITQPLPVYHHAGYNIFMPPLV